MATAITDINQLDLSGTYSYADYLLWKFKERVELFKGKILKMSPAPNVKHQIVSGNIYGYFFPLFRNQKCLMFSAPFDVKLPNKNPEEKDTVVQPDICVVCDHSKLDEKSCIGAPDLVIEILSPGNSKREMKDKFQLYEEAGVREYWVVDPNQESVLIYLLENGKYTINYPIIEDDVYSYIFPNLRIHTDDIFRIP